jgi:hypothetical protein
MINRRSLFKFLAAGAGAALLPVTRAEAALPKVKITRVKCWAHSPPAYLSEFLTFKNGKLYTNDRHGIGVTVDFEALTQIGDFDQARPSNVYSRPDGSLTHW